MKRHQLEHLLRAAGSVSGLDRVIVIGSQSILGARPDAPAELCLSMEADLIFPDAPEKSDLIDGTIGEGSMFHDTYGYYAQGVDFTTAILPEGWQDRLHEVDSPDTRGTKGLCLDPPDLIASKYAAGREKDFEFIRAAFRHQIVTETEVLRQVALLPITPDQMEILKVKVRRDVEFARGDSKA